MPREPSNLVACTPAVLLHDSFNAQSVVELRGFTFAALPSVVPLVFDSDACYSSDAFYTARTQQFSCMHSGGVTSTAQLHQLNLRCWNLKSNWIDGFVVINEENEKLSH